jgi:hypothetical protein
MGGRVAGGRDVAAVVARSGHAGPVISSTSSSPTRLRHAAVVRGLASGKVRTHRRSSPCGRRRSARAPAGAGVGGSNIGGLRLICPAGAKAPGAGRIPGPGVTEAPGPNTAARRSCAPHPIGANRGGAPHDTLPTTGRQAAHRPKGTPGLAWAVSCVGILHMEVRHGTRHPRAHRCHRRGRRHPAPGRHPLVAADGASGLSPPAGSARRRTRSRRRDIPQPRSWRAARTASRSSCSVVPTHSQMGPEYPPSRRRALTALQQRASPPSAAGRSVMIAAAPPHFYAARFGAPRSCLAPSRGRRLSRRAPHPC